MQISDENVHLVRNLMDEVFGADNMCSLIGFRKSGGTTARLLANPADYIIWYARERARVKYHQLYSEKRGGVEGAGVYVRVMSPDENTRRLMTPAEQADPTQVPQHWRIYMLDVLTSQGFRANTTVPFEFEGKEYHPGTNANWKATIDGMKRLVPAGRVAVSDSTLRYVRFVDDFPVYPIDSIWGKIVDDRGIESLKIILLA